MVAISDIERILNNVLKNKSTLHVKCGPTIAEMHTLIEDMRMAGTDFEDMLNKLKEDNQINPLEYNDYENKLKEYNKIYKQWDKASYGTEKYDTLFDELMGIEEDLFQYNRRLVDGIGVKRNEVPVVDVDKFGFDELNDTDLWVKNGGMENQQINNQQSKLKYGEKIDEYTENLLGGDGISYDYEIYNDPRLMSMNNYFNGDCSGINYGISHEGYLNRLSGEQRKEIKNIDSLMEEGGGLVADTLLYRGGYWDIHLNPGDHSKGFKGYQSTTFLESVAKDYVERHEEQTNNKGMLIRILAPKGTKGIAGNDNRFMNGFVEHEYTLARNTGFTVLDVDYDNMVATVILDDP